MAKSSLNAHDQAVILSQYVPYQIDVEHVHTKQRGLLEHVDFLDFKERPTLRMCLDAAMARFSCPQVESVRPVLYNLEDLPQLPPLPNWGFTTPLVGLLQQMHFVASEDEGAGEHVSGATVLTTRSNYLKLAVRTYYVYPSSPGEDDYQDDDDESPDDFRGADYEVTISAFGSIEWRNVTADSLNPEGREEWRHLDGWNLLEVYEFLRQLHVAVGEVAVVEGKYNPDTKANEPQWRYVRKQVPMLTVNKLFTVRIDECTDTTFLRNIGKKRPLHSLEEVEAFLKHYVATWQLGEWPWAAAQIGEEFEAQKAAIEAEGPQPAFQRECRFTLQMTSRHEGLPVKHVITVLEFTGELLTQKELTNG